MAYAAALFFLVFQSSGQKSSKHQDPRLSSPPDGHQLGGKEHEDTSAISLDSLKKKKKEKRLTPWCLQPLSPIEHNGPGLEYKVSYRKAGVDDSWKEHLVKRHSFIVRNTSTFTPYEIKIQSRNSHGWGPEPKTVSGYSGEDGEWGVRGGRVCLCVSVCVLGCGRGELKQPFNTFQTHIRQHFNANKTSCVPTQPSFGIVCGKMCQVKFFFLPSPCVCSSDFASPQEIKRKKKNPPKSSRWQISFVERRNARFSPPSRTLWEIW